MSNREKSSFVDFLQAKGFLAKLGVVCNAALKLILGKPDTTNYLGDVTLIGRSKPDITYSMSGQSQHRRTALKK